MKPSLAAAVGVGLALPALGLWFRYRRDTHAARARVAAVERHVVWTAWGAVEYAEQGHGDTVLAVHGIFHNCVGGLLEVRDLLTDRRVIAPSRFGYLGSSMPPNATWFVGTRAFGVQPYFETGFPHGPSSSSRRREPRGPRSRSRMLRDEHRQLTGGRQSPAAAFACRRAGTKIAEGERSPSQRFDR